MDADGDAADRALRGAYLWAETEDPRVEAISISLIRPDDGRALAGLRPRAELPGPLTVAQALAAQADLPDFAWGSVLAQTDSLDGWAVLIEPNGWAASAPDTIARLSEGGEALNVYWNVNAVMSFAYARNGFLVREFDPLLYDDGGEPLPEEADLPWGADEPRSSALALMERLSGVHIERYWLLERSRPTFIVPVPD